MRRRAPKLISVIGACALVGAGLLVLAPTSSSALTQIVVATNADSGAGSLRQAFIDASSGGGAAGDDVEIIIPASVGTITLTSDELSYDGGTSSAQSMTLRGSGTTITQAAANERVINLTNSGSFTLDGLVLTSGEASDQGGGIKGVGTTTVDILNSTISGSTAVDSGGAFHFGGANLTMTNSTISGNTATGAAGGGFTGGTMTITGSTINGNTSTGSVGGGLITEGLATITNSTITGNTATGGGGIRAQGPLSLIYATVAGNTAGGGANISFNTPQTLTSFGSVVADPLGGGASCGGQSATVTQGYNFEDANSCGFGSGTGDQTNAGSPQLGGLANNGGPTQTMAPAASSGLVDKIPASSPCAGVNITVDQRGLPRPVTAGQFCDIGAFEIQVAALESDRLTFTG